MMPDLLVYLLKVNGALLLFVAVYYALLRQLTFHTLNRWYLLGAIVFSVLYPLADVAALWPQPVALSGELIVWQSSWNSSAPAASGSNYYSWLVGLYWLGVSVLGARLLMQGWSLRRLHRVAGPAGSLPFRRVEGAVTPFSFWQTIYLNPAQHSAAELTAILEHELVHVRQWHTLDVLLGQLQRVLCWPNPAAWLLLRAMQENLEFIADQAVLQAGRVDSKVYQYSLVRLSTLAQGPALVIPFIFHPLKIRIKMMNTPQSARTQAARYLLVLPVALGLLLNGSPLEAAATLTPSYEAPVRPTDIEKPAPVSALPAAALAYIVRQHPGYRLIGVSELRATNGSNLRYKAEIALGRRPVQLVFDQQGQPVAAAATTAEPLYFLDGKPTTKAAIDQLDPKAIAYVSVLKKEEALSSFGASASDGAILIVTKANQNSAPVQAFIKAHNLTFTQLSPEAKQLSTRITRGQGLTASDLQGRLLLVNGQEATPAESKIEAGRLQSVYIMEATEATEKYGDKGKNGAILISTK